jgi:hypothetical protein
MTLEPRPTFDDIPASEKAAAFSDRKFAALILSNNFSFNSSENPASSTAFRPPRPPSMSASSVASARRLDIAPCSSFPLLWFGLAIGLLVDKESSLSSTLAAFCWEFRGGESWVKVRAGALDSIRDA